jgi:hypothetical protein
MFVLPRYLDFKGESFLEKQAKAAGLDAEGRGRRRLHVE